METKDFLTPELKESLSRITEMVPKGTFSFEKPVLPDWSSLIRPPEMPEIEPIFPDGYFEKTQEYQQKSLEMLESINNNTANLYTLVNMINKNNESQEILIEAITEIISIAKAQNKKEADNFFANAMKKINNTVKDAESIVKLSSWAISAYNMIISIIS